MGEFEELEISEFDNTLAADIYADNNGDALSNDIIDEFNAYQIVKDASAEIKNEDEIKVIQGMVRNILVMLVTTFEGYEEGNDFAKAAEQLKRVLYLLGGEDNRNNKNKTADVFKNRFWLKDDAWVYNSLKKLIEFLELKSKPTRRGKNYFSLAVGSQVLNTWGSMNRDSGFSYKDDGEATYEDKEPATTFAAFVNAVKLEIENVMKVEPFKEYEDLYGLRNATNDLKAGKTGFI